jgi:hypothetical protein
MTTGKYPPFHVPFPGVALRGRHVPDKQSPPLHDGFHCRTGEGRGRNLGLSSRVPDGVSDDRRGNR